MTFKLNVTLDTKTPSHYHDWESEGEGATKQRRRYDLGMRYIAEAREHHKTLIRKPCGCTVDSACEECSYQG